MSENTFPNRKIKTESEQKRFRRESETPEERALRLEKQRERQRSSREAQSDQDTAKPREYQRMHQDTARQHETEERTAERLEYKREHQDVARRNETEGQTAKRLEYKREHQDFARKNETEEQTAERLKYKREYQSSVRQDETENDRTVRLQSKTNLYVRSKALQYTRYLNIARFHISSEVSDRLVVEHSIGRMNYNCTFCDAQFWEGEKISTSTKVCSKFSLSCGEGRFVLPPLSRLPELLDHLLTANDTRGKDFRNSIRAYNSSLAFCSLGANIDKELANARRGVDTFSIQGVLHNYIGSLVANCGETPVFAQIYIHDGTPEAEVENRQRHLGEAKLPELTLWPMKNFKLIQFRSFI